jgi:nucleoside-diphosphate-sugar epimerase
MVSEGRTFSYTNSCPFKLKLLPCTYLSTSDSVDLITELSRWNVRVKASSITSSQFDNVLGTISWITSIESVTHIVGVGSQAELGATNGEILETAIDRPTTDYGRAKVQLRHKLFEFGTQTSRKITGGRIFSTYGPLDNAEWFIPPLVSKLIKGEKFEMTKGEQEWSFLHAYDAAEAFRTILNTNPDPNIVNIGYPKTNRIIDVAI